MTDLAFTSAAELARLIARRELSPVELVDAALDRIERSQASLNAFITVCAEEARAAARTAEAAVMRGDALGPLHGVPFSVKDLVNTAGVRTTFGSVALAGNVPAADSVAVARLKQAGAILIGKTTTPEFGHKPFTEAPLFGRTANAWDQSRTSGGSSGGAAVAVAAGLGPLAVGTDGGGSGRIPAACNGVVGFKQTLGLIPHDLTPDGFRQPVLHHADHPHGDGQRVDAAGDGRSRSVRPAFARAAGRGSCRRSPARGRPRRPAHRLAALP